jgi:hypothetical protein
MAIDATGNPVDANANNNAHAGNQKTSESNNSSAKNKNDNSNDGSVTRNIKGKKEVSFDLAELKGKGYPAPVGISNK